MARKYGKLMIQTVIGSTLLGAIVFFVLVGANSGDGGGTVEPSIVSDIEQLRAAADYQGARQLADDFLAQNPELTQTRQQVEYQYALTFYDEQDFAAAESAFGDLVATYTGADFATSEALGDQNVVVDDAKFFQAYVQAGQGFDAAAIASYEALVDQFPGSNREADALRRLGGLYDQAGQHAAAINAFNEVVTRFPEVDFAPEAQLHIGHMRVKQGDLAAAEAAFQAVLDQWPASRFAPAAQFEQAHIFAKQGKVAEAVTAFQAVPDRWPDSRLAPDALGDLNRVLIHEELEARQPQPGVLVPTDVDNANVVNANATRLVQEYPNAPATVRGLHDTINYINERAANELITRDAADAQVVALADLLIQVAPEDRLAYRSKVDYADAIYDEQPDLAWSHLNDALAFAAATQDVQLLNDAEFLLAELHTREGRLVEARAIWENLAGYTENLRFAGEAAHAAGTTLGRAGNFPAAVDAMQAIIDDERYPIDVKTCAMVSQALYFQRLGKTGPALAALEQVMALQPDTTAAAVAASLHAKFAVAYLP